MDQWTNPESVATQAGDGGQPMSMSKRPIALLLGALLCSAGCTHLPWRRTPPEYERPPRAEAYESQLPPEQSADAAMTDADRQAMLEMLDELQSMSGLTLDERQQLMADLRRTKPALWPAMVQQFRAALAFRQQLQERDAAELADDNSVEPRLAALHRAASRPIPGNLRPAALETAQPQPTKTVAAAPHSAVSRQAATAPARPTSPAVPQGPPAAAAPPPAAAPTSLAAAPSLAVTPVPIAAPKPTAVRRTESQEPLTETVAGQPVVTLANLAPTDAGENDWHERLTQAIGDLEQQTSAAPRTGTEVNRHAVLRMLYLIAGRREDALRPIPGIAPAVQDFWSQQLYGLATYLDSGAEPDAARRATVAKQYLCQAASRLGDLGLLSVENLALCTEVSSFGVFQAFATQEFKPGQEALLYAEVNNFWSEESDKGFRTALKSSYQVLDGDGKRVAHREFAVTEDYCKSRRHDFFMRYFIRLPAGLAPGPYTLELTIEDTLANKIGQSSLPLVITTSAAKRGA